MEWLKPPLPPLSESLLASGLVSNSTQVVRSKTGLPKRARSETTRPIQPEIKIKQVWKKQETHRTTRECVPFATAPRFNLPKPNITAAYRPPPIEDYQPRQNNFDLIETSKANQTQGAPSFADTTTKNLREEVLQITRELDANVSSIAVAASEAGSSEKQAELKAQLLNFYNYAFNRYILMEKSTCTERAILLRRFHKFYNQLVADLPTLGQIFESELNEWREKYESVSQQENDSEARFLQFEKEKEKLLEEIDNLKKQLAKTIEESNQKDLTISSNDFDLEFARSQVTQLKFKIQKKDDRIDALQASITKLEGENKNQLNQIEGLTMSINEFQQGQTGYIAMYHEKTAQCEALEKKITEMKNELYSATHRETNDVCVDTSDLVIPTNKSRKRKNTLDAKADYSIFLGEDVKNHSGSKVFSDTILKRKGSHQRLNESISICTVKVDAESQTDNIESNENEKPEINTQENSDPKLENKDIHPTHEIPKNSEQSNQSPNEKSEKIGIIENNSFSSVNQLNYPEGYNIKIEDIDKLPDLIESIIPFLSHAYHGEPIEQEIRLLNNSSTALVVNNERPLIWGLQIIHGFFIDPFVRSIENNNRISIEAIFVDWISRQYKLQHLITQVISDFSSILVKYKNHSEFLQLFYDILTSKITFPQLCFITTIYSFSNAFTFPNLPIMLENLDVSEAPQISIDVIYKFMSKCFTEFFANEIIKNFKATNEDPMVDYFLFLRKTTDFFGEKHKLVYSQSKNLLTLCSCYDSHMINYDTFCQFLSFLGITNQTVLKDSWKEALGHHEDRSELIAQLSDILTICAEKRDPFIKLIALRPLSSSVQKLRSLSSYVSDLYQELSSRFTKIIPHVLSKLSDKIVKKIIPIYEKLKDSILNVEIGTIIWYYKLIVMKIDNLVTEEKGFVPFNIKANSDQIAKLLEYINRCETVAFAMIE
ncbi:hypothetical protein TRFO_12316 [Tritrichomonas foetus]|uniref:Uncharacterized protein n=1 Tax=Tritrichomonas foetus TaxID=1144522 RepID=A0A1J4IZI6_9EUKA|nr:hypothetical protein TRFO_12316 [Tritrichomonas foetus]|eukprot:OHS92760.1 hypothetical protein TRFO_12316 [Tritrichomonas foetus]